MFSLVSYIRHINPVKIHPERIIQKRQKKLVNGLNYDEIEFPVSKEDLSKIETKNNICIKFFCYED